MKYLTLIFCFLFITGSAISQDFSTFSEIELKKLEDYEKAESKVLQTTSYLLSSALDEKDVQRLYATQFLLRWMEGTEYVFTIDEAAIKYTESNDNLLGVYLASMAEYVLENKEESDDEEKVFLGAMKKFVDYIKDKANGVKLDKDLRKLVKATEKGKLEEFLKS